MRAGGTFQNIRFAAAIGAAACLGLAMAFMESSAELSRIRLESMNEGRGPASMASLTPEEQARAASWIARENAPGRPAPDFLARFERLDRKVLKADSDIRNFRALLGTPAFLTDAAHYLSGVEREISVRQTMKRIEVVDFLVEAVVWGDNPAHQEAVRAMSDFILWQPEAANELSPESRRALAGDKIELYNALKDREPDIALRIKRQALASSPELVRLIDFAETGGSNPQSGLRTPKHQKPSAI